MFILSRPDLDDQLSLFPRKYFKHRLYYAWATFILNKESLNV